MKNPGELLMRNKWVAGVTVMAALAISGCGNGRSQNESSQSAQSGPSDSTMLDNLNSFRRDVWNRHNAQIFMGACVAWPNETGGLTVTLDPGLVSIGSGQSEQNYLIFTGREDKGPEATLLPMNGPAVGDGEVLTLAFRPKNIAGGLNRELSSGVIHDRNGQAYYEDMQTALPVLDTALVSGPTSVDFVSSVCDALQHHQPVPGRS